MKKQLQKTSIIVFIILLMSRLAWAQYQPAPMKWGKVTDEELAMKECAFEKEAEAVVLCDYGKLEILPGQFTIQNHKRIKILKDTGLGHADITLTYYSKDKFEKITGVRAQTINVDPSGKLIIEKVESKQIFDAPKNNDYNEIKFTFPNVKVGSILEYEYTLNTQRYKFLDAWYFQSDLPTVHSEFTAVITSQLTYDILYQGPSLVRKYQNKAIDNNNWELDNLNSLKDEPYLWNYWDYAEKIRFQLAGYMKSEGGSTQYQEVINDWNGIVNNVLTAEPMFIFLNRSGVTNKIVEELNLGAKSDLDKVKAIYTYVNQNFRWNGDIRIYPTQNPKELVDSKSGNSAELNLLMLLLLRDANIDAHPALMSTKTHGLPMKKFAFLDQFNHLICYAQVDGTNILLDARADFHPYNLLERMDLNQAAFVLDKKSPRWVDITPPINNIRTVYINHDLRKKQEDDFQGTFALKYDGYYAVSERKKLAKSGEDDYIKANLSFDELQLDKIKLNDVKDPEKPLLIEADIKAGKTLEEDMVYIDPIYLNFYEENLLKADRRFFPVDFLYPDKDYYVLNLSIPDHYEVVELPKDLEIKLPNNGGNYIYSVKKNGSTLQINSRVTLSKSLYPVEEYRYLKEFFDQIRAKHAEQIVLKKKP